MIKMTSMTMKLFVLILMTTQMVMILKMEVIKKRKTVKKVLVLMTHQMTSTQKGINAKILYCN